MKPWRPYWKGLDSAIELLANQSGPAPFGRSSNISSWIAERRFVELASGNYVALGLAETLARNPVLPENWHPVLGGEDISWQLLLRCYCAHDFCTGRIEKRKQFDWTKPSAEIYRYLLNDFWWSSALHWSHRMFPSSKSAVSDSSALNFPIRFDFARN